MVISKILKKAKPKARPKVKPKKKRITPMELKEEVNKIKNFRPGSAAQDRNMERLMKKYDDNVTDFIYNEVMRDLKAKGGRVTRDIDQLPSRTRRLVEFMKEGKIKGGGKPGQRPRRPKPAPPRRLKPKRPNKPAPPRRPKPKPGDRRPKPLPRPPKRPSPGGRFQPKPRPGDRMVLPPRPRKNPTPRLPRSVKELTPEQKRRIMQLVKKGRRTTRPVRKR